MFMAGRGLEAILEKVFDSIPQMLTWKKYPQCIQAQKKQFLADGSFDSHSKLNQAVQIKGKKSRTMGKCLDEANLSDIVFHFC